MHEWIMDKNRQGPDLIFIQVDDSADFCLHYTLRSRSLSVLANLKGEEEATPSLGPIYFHFHAVSSKNDQTIG